MQKQFTFAELGSPKGEAEIRLRDGSMFALFQEDFDKWKQLGFRGTVTAEFFQSVDSAGHWQALTFSG